MTAKRTEKLRKLTAPGSLRRPPVLSSARGDYRFAAPAVARFVPAKSVGSFVPGLTRKAFEKFGFSTAALITDWVQIAGADLARFTVPERLKWPRGPGREDGSRDSGDGESSDARPGATLMLRVDPARALDVEYRSRQIIERINAYFGYRAVQSLRIVQAPLTAPDKTAAPARFPVSSRASAGPQPPGELVSNPPSDPLSEALARLERGVLRDQAARR